MLLWLPSLFTCLFYNAFSQCVQALVIDLDHLPAYAGNVAFGFSHGHADALHDDFIVLIDQLGGAVARGKRSNLLAVLDELHTYALAQAAVGLLGFHLDLLQHNPLGLGTAFQRIGPLFQAHGRANEPFIMPSARYAS